MSYSPALALEPLPADIAAQRDYGWMDWLSSAGWSWEFLRRSPDYLQAYAKFCRSRAFSHSEAAAWGLRYFEDPTLDAASANVFWKMQVSPDVLPIQAVPAGKFGSSPPLAFDSFDCRVTIHTSENDIRSDVLFAKNGCFLQLAVFGDTPLRDAMLLTPVLTEHSRSGRHRNAMRRLDDLARTGTMRPALYRQESRVRRLKHVLRALDGSLAKQSYRQIAVTMFGADRVEREWSDPRDNLRDQVRRAVRCGKDFMEGGYRQFVS